MTLQVLMIPKRQDSEESTEEQEQEETKEGKTHTADKAKKGEIDNGDLSRLTAAATCAPTPQA